MPMRSLNGFAMADHSAVSQGGRPPDDSVIVVDGDALERPGSPVPEGPQPVQKKVRSFDAPGTEGVMIIDEDLSGNLRRDASSTQPVTDEYPSWWKGRKSLNSSTINSFRCFVDRVLFFHDMVGLDKFLLKFRLKRGKTVDSSSAYRWISGAVKRGVKHLDFNISFDKFTLPDDLFTCRTLVTLKLDIGLVLNVPLDIHFPNLKTLHLKSVKLFDDNSVKSLFSNCSSLEDVVIEKCSFKYVQSFSISHPWLKRLAIIHSCDSAHCWLVIDTPYLSNFKYIGHVVAGYSLKKQESLVSADIQFLFEDKDLQADARHATSIFRQIYNVRSLVMSPYSLELLSSSEPLPAFPTLVELDIPYNKVEQLNSMDNGLEALLPHCPELENLAFPQDVLNSLPEEVPSCLLFKVKVIEISNFEYDQDCIRKAKYILENGGALEKLTILTSNIWHGYKLEISQVLFAYPRKSKECFILIV
ncbi:hypothetical protein V6N13_088153 [Hibiscus sabdariffa]